MASWVELDALARRIRSNGERVELFELPTREQLFWVKIFDRHFPAKDALAASLSMAALVSPLSHVSIFSFRFQAYLFHLFHQTSFARVIHTIFFPAVVLSAMIALAAVPLTATPLTRHESAAFGWNGALLFAVLLGAWYLALAVREKMIAWGLVMVGLTATLLIAANLVYSNVFTVDPASHRWYAPTPIEFNPYLWMFVSSLVIALSHLAEPRLPPRASKATRWMTVSEFMKAGPLVPRSLHMLFMLLSGICNELWGSPRLFPYAILNVMHGFGYKATHLAQLKDQADRALTRGEPALDYIGIGGDAYLPGEAEH